MNAIPELTRPNTCAQCQAPVDHSNGTTFYTLHVHQHSIDREAQLIYATLIKGGMTPKRAHELMAAKSIKATPVSRQARIYLCQACGGNYSELITGPLEQADLQASIDGYRR